MATSVAVMLEANGITPTWPFGHGWAHSTNHWWNVLAECTLQEFS